MTKLKYQIKPKIQKFKVLSVKDLLKNSDVYNLLSSLARRFACCQSCSVLLRTLWAYGFDSAARRALEKSKVGEVNLEVSSRIVFNFKP